MTPTDGFDRMTYKLNSFTGNERRRAHRERLRLFRLTETLRLNKHRPTG